MNRLLCGFLAAALGFLTSALLADSFGNGANSFDIDFVTVGNPGNPADTSGLPNPAGSVAYSYRIGKYEISEQMIDRANALGGLGITKDSRGPNKPATSVSWYEAAKFVNWLNTSTGNHAAYKFDSAGNFEVWDPSDPGYVPGVLLRNSLAKYVLPSVDEWYKAAYYDSAGGVYYRFPTGSNDPPLSASGTTSPGTAVYMAAISDIMQSGGLSPYGTMAQGGNAAEWMETNFLASGHFPNTGSRAFRGGDFSHFGNDLRSDWGNVVVPSGESATVGFRVASVVQEPSAFILFCAGLILAWNFRSPRPVAWRCCNVEYAR